MTYYIYLRRRSCNLEIVISITLCLESGEDCKYYKYDSCITCELNRLDRINMLINEWKVIVIYIHVWYVLKNKLSNIFYHKWIKWFSNLHRQACRIPSFHNLHGLSRFLFPNNVNLNSLWDSLSNSIFIRCLSHLNPLISFLSSIVCYPLVLFLITISNSPLKELVLVL